MPGWARETNEVSCLPTTVVTGAHTHAHTDIHRHTDTNTHTQTQTNNTHTQTHTHTHTHTHAHTHTHYSPCMETDAEPDSTQRPDWHVEIWEIWCVPLLYAGADWDQILLGG